MRKTLRFSSTTKSNLLNSKKRPFDEIDFSARSMFGCCLRNTWNRMTQLSLDSAKPVHTLQICVEQHQWWLLFIKFFLQHLNFVLRFLIHFLRRNSPKVALLSYFLSKESMNNTMQIVGQNLIHYLEVPSLISLCCLHNSNSMLAVSWYVSAFLCILWRVPKCFRGREEEYSVDHAQSCSIKPFAHQELQMLLPGATSMGSEGSDTRNVHRGNETFIPPRLGISEEGELIHFNRGVPCTCSWYTETVCTKFANGSLKMIISTSAMISCISDHILVESIPFDCKNASSAPRHPNFWSTKKRFREGI